MGAPSVVVLEVLTYSVQVLQLLPGGRQDRAAVVPAALVAPSRNINAFNCLGQLRHIDAATMRPGQRVVGPTGGDRRCGCSAAAYR